VYDSYGKKCNSRFLLNYGFYNEENDSNEVPVEMSISHDDQLFYDKLAYLKGAK
jgi:histone-lysine N-methyltransferase SETD3